MQFEIKGINYRTAKLDVFQQLKVGRKLLPIIAGMAADFQTVKNSAQGGDVYGTLETILPKIADALADMSEDDTNAIIHPCLGVVSRQNGTAWAPVMSSGQLMFDDIDLFSMLQLVGRVVGDSLGNFFPTLPDNGTPPPSAE